jgi:hypothetical protein
MNGQASPLGKLLEAGQPQFMTLYIALGSDFRIPIAPGPFAAASVIT